MNCKYEPDCRFYREGCDMNNCDYLPMLVSEFNLERLLLNKRTKEKLSEILLEEWMETQNGKTDILK